jgi:hypothetical protein
LHCLAHAPAHRSRTCVMIYANAVPRTANRMVARAKSRGFAHGCFFAALTGGRDVTVGRGWDGETVLNHPGIAFRSAETCAPHFHGRTRHTNTLYKPAENTPERPSSHYFAVPGRGSSPATNPFGLEGTSLSRHAHIRANPRADQDRSPFPPSSRQNGGFSRPELICPVVSCRIREIWPAA